MASKPAEHHKTEKDKPAKKVKPAFDNPEELLAQADPDAAGPPPLASSMPVGEIAHPMVWPKQLGFMAAGVVLVAVALGGGWWLSQQGSRGTGDKLAASATPSPADDRLKLVAGKNYGNKYASGVLPVGDGRYSTQAPQVGRVYACSGYAQNLTQDSGGASTRGPWFTNNNAQWDVNKKPAVAGHVSWPGSFSGALSGTTRTIKSNGLPSHYTGTFPISSKDPVYQYDRNPNAISAQTLTYDLSADPQYLTTPACMGGQVGIMLSGVPLFSAFDAGGRDAGAWEVQDGCDGHPEKTGEYHYHTLSRCISDASVSTVIGFALDGYPITGPKVGETNMLTTSDLDVCHGLTSEVMLDGHKVTTYHYVMTQDFPYSVSCFRAKAIQPPALTAPGTPLPPVRPSAPPLPKR